MTVRMTPEKIKEIIECCETMIKKKRVTIREFAQLIGKLVASQPGVEYAPLFYKPLERVKDKMLTIHKGNFNSFMTIPQSVYPTITWWIENLQSALKCVSHGAPNMILYSDESSTGWGAYNKTEEKRIGGMWSLAEQALHINLLELKACHLNLLMFCKNARNQHIKIYMDNTTSCAYISKLGGKKSNALAREIWFWCIERKLHLTAAHIAGHKNVEADKESRIINDDLERSLCWQVFEIITQLHPGLSVDLFASRLNFKLQKYVSRRPEPNTYAIDAFSLTWSHDFYYLFPPFSLLPRILQKIAEDQTEAVLVAPIRPTQTWWPSLLQVIVGECYNLPSPQKCLFLPNKPDRKHPLRKMKFRLFRVSGRRSKIKVSLNKLEISFLSHGEQALNSNTIPTFLSGSDSAMIKLTPLNLP
ncbi:uncharacterized protein LOC128549987 [Mercenaria mercenaria]|uniref:uncharacterized protein LOC128549987 n=1 Tax=Mercenaria mercenaria TaxID=6596 RepID=UPI00234F4150|nr:uncharacterized protein LOC128549987 [Mercenaria mercenaria]